MRIRGSGAGFSGFGGGDSRSDYFRQGRRPGQKVRGKLLKWVSDDMAWVDIEGHNLLAQLQSSPPVGALLTFIIKQLTPEIVLKEVFGSSTVTASTLSMASSFETARTLFEGKFQPHREQLGNTPSEDRLSTFMDILGTDTKLLAAFHDTLACVTEINHHFKESKNSQISYQPWLLPEGRRHVTLVRTSHLTETIFEFEMERFGMVQAQFLHKDGDVGYRLKLQHPTLGSALKKFLAARAYPALPTTTIECLGVSKLPRSSHGGVVAELMFSK